MDKAGLLPHTYTMPMCMNCYQVITGELAPKRWLNYGGGLVACIRCWRRIDFKDVWGVPGLVIIDDVNAPYRLWSPDHASEKQYVIQVGSTDRGPSQLLAWAEAWRQQRALKKEEEPSTVERLEAAVRADDRRLWSDMRQIIEETPAADRPAPTMAYAGGRPGVAEAPAPPSRVAVDMYATDADGSTWRDREVAEAEIGFAQYAANFPLDASEDAALPHGYDPAADAQIREQVLAMRHRGGVTAWPESMAAKPVPAEADLRDPDVFRREVEKLMAWYREKGIPMPQLERLEVREKAKVPGIHPPRDQQEQEQQPDGQQPDGQVPNGQVPTSEHPNGQVPTSEHPTGQMPTSEHPNGQQPASQQPISQQPNDQLSNDQLPTSQHPTGQQPAVGPGANEPKEPRKTYPKPGFGAPPVIF